MAQPPDSVSMALFCDFENVALGVRDAKYDKFDIRKVLERLLLKGSIVVKKAYCDWDRYREFKAPMHEASFELIEIPHVRQSGKNSADIRMVVDALDLCYTKTHVNTFVIISGDSDFSPLVSKLRENNKTVIGVGVKGSTSDLLTANCDEFIFYDDLVRESRRRSTRAGPSAQPGAGNGQAANKTAARMPAAAAATAEAAPSAAGPSRTRGNGRRKPPAVIDEAGAASAAPNGASPGAEAVSPTEPATLAGDALVAPIVSPQASTEPPVPGETADAAPPARKRSPRRGKVAAAETTVTHASAISAAAPLVATTIPPTEVVVTDPPAPRNEDERRQQAIDLALETVEALITERGADDKIWGSMVKQTLKRRRPGFAEGYYGYRSFNELLEDARDRGLLALEHDEKSGGYVIRLL
jgi:uncharacterized LabA/DUF88 family protein